MRGQRICDKCQRTYYRSNLVRLWVATNFGHRAGWVRSMQKLCCRCMAAADAQAVMRDIDQKWRLLKPEEQAAHAPRTKVR